MSICQIHFPTPIILLHWYLFVKFRGCMMVSYWLLIILESSVSIFNLASLRAWCVWYPESSSLTFVVDVSKPNLGPPTQGSTFSELHLKKPSKICQGCVQKPENYQSIHRGQDWENELCSMVIGDGLIKLCNDTWWFKNPYICPDNTYRIQWLVDQKDLYQKSIATLWFWRFRGSWAPHSIGKYIESLAPNRSPKGR